MSLLMLESVSKRYGRDAMERVGLQAASLEIEAGELVAVWGRRRSGRSTLLRVAAGLERPDEGLVRFEGRDLSAPGADAVRGGIRFCRKTFRPAGGQLVLDQLVTGQLTLGVPSSVARSRARECLRRVGAERCASTRPGELDHAEVVRVAIARALVHEPKLLVIDEPTLGVDLPARDQILSLLRSLTGSGTAVLMSAGETTSLSGADRAMSLSKGVLRGEVDAAELAPVVPLRPAVGWIDARVSSDLGGRCTPDS
jgi:ABC-type sugar transport system ATPase subunit